MESWLPALFGLGGVLVGSFFSLWLTKLQLNNADKRFERELLKTREDAQRQRRWEVRGEPLLKLRAELPRMATVLQTLVTNTQLTHNQSGVTGEEQRALDDWRNYMTSGQFLPILYLQYDEELLKLVEEIENDYLLLFEYALDYRNLGTDELRSFRQISQKVKNGIPKVQELITKRLEQL